MRARGSGALGVTTLALLGVVTFWAGVRGGGGGEEGVDVLPFGFREGSVGVVQLLDGDSVQIVQGDAGAPGIILNHHHLEDFDSDPSDGSGGRRSSVHVRALGPQIGVSSDGHRLKLDGDLLLEDLSSADGESLYLNVNRKVPGIALVFVGDFQPGVSLAEQFADQPVFATLPLGRAGISLAQVRAAALQTAALWGFDIGLMVVADEPNQQVLSAYGAVFFESGSDLYQVEMD